jgi:hypothetical protein
MQNKRFIARKGAQGQALEVRNIERRPLGLSG